ncbi:UDP-N-acetylmuramoyl-L-alanyl-D-glutamate--2,6-diaminopimelate ligase [bacterium]|nr:UDP-N-acetylmuramoyl-L-alanyl-D-glutamate--2,6-diaminopimelate ligase [bacterium]
MKRFIRKFIPHFIINCYHFALAFLGACLYGFPSRKLKVIGVTGTNGKSTVVFLITKMLEEAGFRVASISSIEFKIGDKEWQNTLKMTMPGRLKLQKFLKEAVKENCQYAVIEVTSEGVLQHRHRFIDFDIAVFTNLTPEHIEAHGSFENYKKAKGKFFESLEKSKKKETVSVINLDDNHADYFLKFKADKKIGYTTSKENIKECDSLKTVIKASRIIFSAQGAIFEINNVRFSLRLKGMFNVYNTLAAVAVGLSQGIDILTIKRSLEKIKNIPGRLEEVIDVPFKVIVDYAHTPDALRKVYKTLNSSKTQSLICVLGSCGGGRDKWKRPELGRIADSFCKKIILTNEDPYDEDPLGIIREIRKGIKNREKIIEIIDRKEAIKKALEIAGENDIVIITGKGCEPWMCIKGGKKIPWDDRKIVKEAIKELTII